MQPFTIDPAALGDLSALVGVTITEDARAGGKRLFHKGRRLGQDDLALLSSLDDPVHAVRLEPDDVHENDAGIRLARAVDGGGLEIRGPVQSRYNLVSTVKGLLRVDEERLLDIDTIPGVAVFTLPDRMTVVPGRIAAGVKITPVALPERDLARAEALAAGDPVVRVEPFRPLKVGVVTTEAMSGTLRERFREAVERKVRWYGASVARFLEPAAETGAVADAFASLLADGADVILAAGETPSTRSTPRCWRCRRSGRKCFGSARRPTRAACSGWRSGAKRRSSISHRAACTRRRPWPISCCRG